MNKIKKIMLLCNQLKSNLKIIEKQMLGMKIKKSWLFKRADKHQFKMIKRHLYQSVWSSLLTSGRSSLCRVKHHSPREEEVWLEVKL
jgi:ribonuclease HI